MDKTFAGFSFVDDAAHTAMMNQQYQLAMNNRNNNSSTSIRGVNGSTIASTINATSSNSTFGTNSSTTSTTINYSGKKGNK
jgi:hypothetical protein